MRGPVIIPVSACTPLLQRYTDDTPWLRALATARALRFVQPSEDPSALVVALERLVARAIAEGCDLEVRLVPRVSPS